MKYLLMACLPLFLVACATKDEQYYRMHPQALEDAVKACPAKEPSQLNCQQLTELSKTMKDLAYQLQTNPPAFGKKILALQENMAKQKAELKTNPNQPELRKQLEETKQQLTECLAIVKWLEAPES